MKSVTGVVIAQILLYAQLGGVFRLLLINGEYMNKRRHAVG
jgi:hypothetical protein